MNGSAKSSGNEAATDAWTVKRILDWTTTYLKENGSDTARLDSEILLAHARKCQRIQLYTRYEEVLSESERATMRDLVQRRARAEPVAYLVGHREFFSLDFQVTRDVLIPRPDTETLVVEAIELAKLIPQPKLIDVGTGSGCIAVSLAVSLPKARIVATDISSPALAIASANASRNEVADRIEFRKGDLLQAVDSQSQFDLIVSNPPYIRQSEMATLQADVQNHEPHLALDGGADGLDLVRRLAQQAGSHLLSRGHLLLEISPEQAQATKAILETAGFGNVRVVNDLSGKARVVRGQLLDRT